MKLYAATVIATMSSSDNSVSITTTAGTSTAQYPVPFYTLPVNLPLPEKLEISTGTLVNNWRKFKRAWENYEVAAQLKDPQNPAWNKERRAATLLTSLGSDALDVLEGLPFEEEIQRKDPEVILETLEKYCIGEVNESFERYTFNKRDQEQHEAIDAYVAALRVLAKTCNYGQLTDSLIRDRIILGIRDNAARKKLLQTQKLTLKHTVDIVRSFEVAAQQLKQISPQEEIRQVNRKLTSYDRKADSSNKVRGGNLRCKFCNRQHAPERSKCIAWGRTCNTCGQKNHFAACCTAQPRVNYVEHEDDVDEYVASVDSSECTNQIDTDDSQNKAFATLVLNKKEEKFQLDTGATVNVLSESKFEALFGKHQLNKL